VRHQPDHPDQQQLAAFQAGELGRRERARLETHLGACAGCAALLAAAEQAGRLLAALPLEPELPPGLQERLATAVEREIATQPSRPSRAAQQSRRSRQAPAWYRRRGALGLLGAAAALLLLVALVPRLHPVASPKRTSSGAASSAAGPATAAGQAAAGEAAQPPTRVLAVINAPHGFSARDLKADLAADPSARAAFSAARSGVPGPTPLNPKSSAQPDAGTATTTASSSGAAPTGPSGNKAMTSIQASCLAAAARLAPGARPALVVTTVYQGKPATVLVTVAAGNGGGTVAATLWYFAGGSCGQQPLHHEETTVTLP